MRQNRTEMSEGNRIHAFLPDCAHLFRSDRNRRVRSHPNRSRILWKIFFLIVLMVRRGCACAEGRCVAVAGEAHEFGDQANGTLASIHFGSGLKRLLWCAHSAFVLIWSEASEGSAAVAVWHSVRQALTQFSITLWKTNKNLIKGIRFLVIYFFNNINHNFDRLLFKIIVSQQLYEVATPHNYVTILLWK